jgi:hypothetical protein
MAAALAPFPQQASPGDFAWIQWMNQLQNLLNTTGAVDWSLVNKAGSSLGDLQQRDHSYLTSVLGTGSYHLSQSEQQKVTSILTKAGDPNTSDIGTSKWAIYKNTSSGAVKLWVNDAGTMKSVTLT